MWSPPYFTTALLNFNVHTIVWPQKHSKTKNENRKDDEDGCQCWLFALFTLRSWEVRRDDTPLSPLFLSNYRAEEKHPPNWGEEGRRGHLHSQNEKPNWGIYCQLCNHGLRFKMALIWYFHPKSSPLVKTSHGLSTNFAIFTANCMDWKLVKSEDCA